MLNRVTSDFRIINKIVRHYVQNQSHEQGTRINSSSVRYVVSPSDVDDQHNICMLNKSL